MENYEMEIKVVENYKCKACELVDGNCEKCQAMYKYNDKKYCCFDTTMLFIKWANKYNVI